MKKKNQGFSLVELLVSIVILAIIMIPILDNIVVATRMNLRAKQAGDVTTLASNVMESMKGQESLKETAKDLLSKDKDKVSEIFLGAGMTNAAISELEKKADVYVPATESCLKEDISTKEMMFSPNASGIYQFGIQKLKYNDQFYDAVVTYDASVYKTETSSINNQEIPVLSSVSTKESAVITEGNSRTCAISALKLAYFQWFSRYGTGENTVTEETIEKSMETTFEITAEYSVDKASYLVKAEAEYSLGTDLIPATAEKNYRTYKTTLLYNSYSKISDIYLFYTPNLKKKFDTLNVNNHLPKEKNDLNVYVIEQKQTVSSYETLIASYKLKLNIYEKHYAGGEKYHTTFRRSLGDSAVVKPEIITNVADPDKLSLGELVQTETKDRLYQITVELYETDEKEPFAKKNLLTTVTTAKGDEK